MRTGKAPTAFVAAAALFVFAAPAGSTPLRTEAMPLLYKNCASLNKKYPDGIGRVGARDKTKSGDPVTNFKRSSKLYNLALSHNRGLDRDKDGVACEKD